MVSELLSTVSTDTAPEKGHLVVAANLDMVTRVDPVRHSVVDCSGMGIKISMSRREMEASLDSLQT